MGTYSLDFRLKTPLAVLTNSETKKLILTSLSVLFIFIFHEYLSFTNHYGQAFSMIFDAHNSSYTVQHCKKFKNKMGNFSRVILATFAGSYYYYNIGTPAYARGLGGGGGVLPYKGDRAAHRIFRE